MRSGSAAARLLRLPVLLYRARLGWLLGGRFLLLEHAGRRSGRRYRSVVEVLGHDRVTGEFFVMSGFGRSADWYLNVRSGGAAQVTVGRRSFRPAVRELDAAAAVVVLGDYERRNRVATPVVRRVLSRLLGWRYSGTADDRARAVAQLPILGFRPAGTSEHRPVSES